MHELQKVYVAYQGSRDAVGFYVEEAGDVESE